MLGGGGGAEAIGDEGGVAPLDKCWFSSYVRVRISD